MLHRNKLFLFYPCAVLLTIRIGLLTQSGGTPTAALPIASATKQQVWLRSAEEQGEGGAEKVKILDPKPLEKSIKEGRDVLEWPWRKPTGVVGSFSYKQDLSLFSPMMLQVPDMTPEVYFAKYVTPRLVKAPERQLVVDVGANVGQFAISISKAGIDSYNFEPGPATCSTLKHNIAKADLGNATHGQMRVICAAVGASQGMLNFKMGNVDSTSFMTTKENGPDVIQVPVVSLNDVIPHDRRIALLKTDTQGFEMGVLRGASALLRGKNVGLLMIEMSYSLLRGAGSSPKELMEYVYSFDYSCTYMAFHGHLAEDKFGVLPPPPSIKGKSTISFNEMEQALKSIGPTGRPGWTDLLCW